MVRRVCLGLLLALIAQAAFSAATDEAMAARVKQEFLHAWSGYKRFAWGHDELQPLTQTARDWYGVSLLMTPVDALDTLILMGERGEADRARELIDSQLSFDRDIEVKNFEVTIRLLGGLLSAYQLSDDPKLLELARDLGHRLLPVFDSPTGMPYQYVNLRSGKPRGVLSNPAETGTLILEFGTLSQLTGEKQFFEKAKRALTATFARRSPIGLVGDQINVETGAWSGSDSHVSAGIDSYYEYLYKCWRLFGDHDCLAMWNRSITAINRYLADSVNGELWYGHADMATGRRTASEYGALDAFFPALLVYSGRVKRAQALQESSLKMWNLHAVEPEAIDYRRMEVTEDGYPLRPEIVESTYYLYHFTQDEKYRAMGESLFNDFVRACRSEYGYAALSSVTSKQQKNSMESFVFAETFKYFYLLFAPADALRFDSIVFNTEAHPLRRSR